MSNFLTSLSASWEFEDAASPFLDDTANNNDLVVSGVTLEATGLFNKCGSYDGVNDLASLAHASTTGLSPGLTSFSIEAWITVNVAGGSLGIVAKRETVSGTQFYRLGKAGTPDKVFFAITSNTGANQASVTGGTTLTTDNVAKYQVVAVCDRSAQLIHIYLNGESDATAVDCSAVESVNNTDPFEIGAFSGASFWKGKIDRVRFWSGRALSASEVLELYNAGNGLAYGELNLSSERNGRNARAILRLP